MKKGNLVKFAIPENEQESKLIFLVLEDRENRVLVQEQTLFNNWNLKPTSVYLKTDLILTEATK
jgi:hypothetical protein